MALKYKLEFVKDEGGPADDSVFIQLRRNTPIYQDHIDKEDYDILPSGEKHEFLTGLFNISGVVELSSKAYRVWLMKSPVFNWEEVLLPVLNFMKDYYSESSLDRLPGSASPDGKGTRLEEIKDRRDI